MAESNAELVRRTIELWNAQDVDAALELAHDDFFMDWSESIGPLKGVYAGREEVFRLWDRFIDVWESVRWEPEIVELDETHVLVVAHVRMSGKGSGAEVEAHGTLLWTIEDGRGRGVKLYQTKEDALAAIG